MSEKMMVMARRRERCIYVALRCAIICHARTLLFSGGDARHVASEREKMSARRGRRCYSASTPRQIRCYSRRDTATPRRCGREPGASHSATMKYRRRLRVAYVAPPFYNEHSTGGKPRNGRYRRCRCRTPTCRQRQYAPRDVTGV